MNPHLKRAQCCFEGESRIKSNSSAFRCGHAIYLTWSNNSHHWFAFWRLLFFEGASAAFECDRYSRPFETENRVRFEAKFERHFDQHRWLAIMLAVVHMCQL